MADKAANSSTKGNTFVEKLSKRPPRATPTKRTADTFTVSVEDGQPQPTHRTTVLLPWNLYIELKTRCQETGVTITRQITTALEMYLRDSEGPLEIP